MTDTTTATAVLPAKDVDYALTVVLPHADKPAGMLPVLQHVKMTAKDGTLTLAATDRYTVGIVTMPWDGPDVDALLPRATVEAVAKLAKVEAKRRFVSGTPFVALTVDGDTLDVHAGEIRTSLPIDTRGNAGSFPDYARLIPSGTPSLDGAMVGLNPQHFVKLAKVSPGRTPSLRFTFYGPTRPCTVERATRDDDLPTFLALVMPVRLATA